MRFNKNHYTVKPLWGWSLLFGVLYFASASASYWAAIGTQNVSAFWLPSGLFIAALLLQPPGRWIWFLAAGGIATFIFHSLHHLDADTCAVLAIADAIEALAGACLVRRFVSDRPPLESVRNVIGFAGLAGVLSTGLGSAISIMAHGPMGTGPGLGWAYLWCSHATGVLIGGTAVLAWATPQWFSLRSSQVREALALTLLFTVCCGVVLFQEGDPLPPRRYLLVLFTMWAGVRFGYRGATLASLAIAIVTVLSVKHGTTLLSALGVGSAHRLEMMQTFIGISSLTGLIGAAIKAQGTTAEELLRPKALLFRKLFDDAPEGIALSDASTGLLIDCNEAFLHMTGHRREDLIGTAEKILYPPESQDALPSEGYSQPSPKSHGRMLSTRMLTRSGQTLWVEIKTSVLEIGRTRIVQRFYRDITERVRFARDREITLGLLRLLNDSSTTEELIRKVTFFLQRATTCELVRIYLRPEDELPRMNLRPTEVAEPPVMECFCGQLLQGPPEPLSPCYIGGSFVRNRHDESSPLLKQKETANQTCACCSLGDFESAALIPLRFGLTALGLLKIADPHPDRFNPELLKLLESAADQIALAIAHRQMQAALRESQATLQSFYDSSPFLMGLGELEGDTIRAIHGNAAVAKFLGVPPGDISGSRAEDLNPQPEENQMWLELYRRSQREGAPIRKEFIHHSPSGPRWVRATVAYMGDSRRGWPRFSFVAEDATEAKQAEEALRESEERYRLLFEEDSDAIVLIDCASGKILDANPSASTLFSHSHAEFLELNATDMFEDGERARQSCISRQKFISQTKCRKRDKAVFPAEIFFSYFIYNGQEAQLAAIRDISERIQTEHALRESREQLRALAARIEAVREEERTAVAREIHDVLAQELTRLKIDIIWLTRHLPRFIAASQAPAIYEKLTSMTGLTNSSIESVQKIATELRPLVLDSLGLCAAVEWQVREFETRTRIPCALDLPKGELELSRERSTAVFRTLQESLTNIMRHANANRVSIQLQSTPESITLRVEDNGKGIEAMQLKDWRSIGLLGMRERAALLGGTCSISGRQGQGTTVELRLPIPPEIKKTGKNEDFDSR